MKIVQPISDPDDIREEAEETKKESYAGYYVNQPAPDPLTWRPKNPPQDDKPAEDQTTTDAAELSRQNDPLKDQ